MNTLFYCLCYWLWIDKCRLGGFSRKSMLNNQISAWANNRNIGGVFIFKFEHVSYLSLHFLLFTLNTYLLRVSQKSLKFLMKEAMHNYYWKQKDGKCKQNLRKEIADDLIVLTCKEHSWILSGDLRTIVSSVFIYCYFFIQATFL